MDTIGLVRNEVILFSQNYEVYVIFKMSALYSIDKITDLDHPPYLPDLAPADFWLFPEIKLAMKGDRQDTHPGHRKGMYRSLRYCSIILGLGN
jgi:hypothetical protein